MPRHHSLPQFEFMVMLAIAHLDGEGFAVDVRRTIEELSGRTAVLGAVYAALGRLEAKGLLRHRRSAARGMPGGRERKRFLLTPTGSAELAEARDMLRRMLDAAPATPRAP